MSPLGKHSSYSPASPPSFTHLDHRSVNALLFKPDQSTGLGRLWIIHACLACISRYTAPFPFPRSTSCCTYPLDLDASRSTLGGNGSW